MRTFRSLALLSLGALVAACAADVAVAGGDPPATTSPDAAPDVSADAAPADASAADAAFDADADASTPAPDLDPAFGEGGALSLRPEVPGEDDARAMLVEPDGKILVVGSTTYPTLRVLMARFDRDGALDPDFGNGGVLTQPFGAAAEALAVARQNDGKIVVAGATHGGPSGIDFMLMRFLDDGTIDSQLGDTGTGKVSTAFGDSVDRANAVIVQPDGKIVAAGEAFSEATGKDFALARYLPDGALDTTFHATGKVVNALDGRQSIHALAAQVVDGEVRLLAGGTDGAAVVLRYRASGDLDTTFGVAGVARDVFGSGVGSVQAVALAADGSIVVAGDAAGEMAAARLDASGAPVTTFGDGGVRVVPGHPDEPELATSLALDPGGRIWLGGWRHAPSTGDDVAVARLESGGALDVTFGVGGVRSAPLAPLAQRDLARAIALQHQPGGGLRPVVAGAVMTPGAKIVVARF